MSKICCFTGHREIEKINPSVLYSRLDNVIKNLIENEGVTDFRAGGAKGFDNVAASHVIMMKKKYPHIKLHLFLPCKSQASRFNDVEKQVYDFVLRNADSVRYTSDKYYDGVFLARDRQLVDGADVCVAFMTKLTGGTHYTVTYARKQRLTVINLLKG